MVVCPSKKLAALANKVSATHHCFADQGPRFHCMQINAPFLSSDCIDINGCDDYNSFGFYVSGDSRYRIKELEVYSLDQLN